MKGLFYACKQANVLAEMSLLQRYGSTARSLWWPVILPLLSSLILSVISVGLFEGGLLVRYVYVLSGMIAWSLIGPSIGQGFNLYRSRAGLLHAERTTLATIPLSLEIELLRSSIGPILALQIVMASADLWNPYALVSIPAVALISLALLPVAWFSASLGVLFPRLRPGIPVVMQIMFIATPVFWPSSALDSRGGGLLVFNPLVAFLDILRIPLGLGSGSFMPWIILLLFYVGALLLWLFGRRSLHARALESI